jgi:hypothetical protein
MHPLKKHAQPRSTGMNRKRSMDRKIRRPARIGRWSARGAIFAAAFFFLSAADAADNAGNFATKGVGLATCAQFTKLRAEKAPEFFLFVGWIDGYLSSVNQFNNSTFDVTSWERTELITAILDAHCKEYPSERFGLAVSKFLQAVHTDRLKNKSKLLTLEYGGQKETIYQATLKRMQQALAKKGHYEGTADGIYGPETRGAIESYQKAEKLTVTGLPDQLTLHHLFRISGH